MLITKSHKTSLTTANVAWRSGGEAFGNIEVSIPYESSDVDIVAELVAINYLIFEKKVLGNTILHGYGIELEVSKGAIKKILNKKSDKKDVAKYASFIDFLLKGVTIKTHKKCSKDVAPALENLERITTDIEKYTNTRLLINAPAIGKVEITNHSVERYLERAANESGDIKYALKSLINRLSNTGIKMVKLPASVLAHKERKYGKSDDYSVWMHPTSTLNFGLLKKEDVYYLVTVFINNNQELRN